MRTPVFSLSLLTTLCSLALSLGASAQTQDDPTVMRVAGRDVSRSEFEYNYNKNLPDTALRDQQDIDNYAQLFIGYKLKVRAAEDALYDTLQSFREEFRTYRDQLIRPMLASDSVEEQEALAYYEGMVRQLNGHDLRLPAHIFLRLSPNAPAEEQARQKARADSIYEALQGGADFEELAKQCSEDRPTAVRGGVLGWYGPNSLLPEFEKVMYELNKGEVSAPFLSTVGYHIVRLNDTKLMEPYDTLRPRIITFLESRGLRERLAREALDTLASQQGISVEEVMDNEAKRLCDEDKNLRYLVQEYHDGLLLYEICKREVWDPAAKDTAALEQYFKKHKKNYAWDKPRFRGMVFHVAKPEDVALVKKALKGVDESLWAQTVKERFNADSVTVRTEHKLFVLGENAFVDSLVFKTNAAKTKPRKGYPYSGVIGKTIKKGPQRWTDVSGQVVSDYQALCDESFAEELRKRYDVEVYDDVLKTVNNH